jgi:hypothetical protein
MKTQVTRQEAKKSDDWKCAGGINAGDDSYRVYESEKMQQEVVEDGKNESFDLAYLKGNPIQKPNTYSMPQGEEAAGFFIYETEYYALVKMSDHHVICYKEIQDAKQSKLYYLTDEMAINAVKAIQNSMFPENIKCINTDKPYYTIGKIYKIYSHYDYRSFSIKSDDGKERIVKYGKNWENIS